MKVFLLNKIPTSTKRKFVHLLKITVCALDSIYVYLFFYLHLIRSSVDLYEKRAPAERKESDRNLPFPPIPLTAMKKKVSQVSWVYVLLVQIEGSR